MSAWTCRGSRPETTSLHDVGTIFTVHAGAVGRLDTFLVSKAQTVHGGISVLAEISSKLGSWAHWSRSRDAQIGDVITAALTNRCKFLPDCTSGDAAP